VHARVEECHRSREFANSLKLLDAAYPANTTIKLILDNHSAHVSKETKAWLANQPEGRFSLVFTPKHGSWLNLVEGFLSKMARSMLRHIRVAAKAELKSRILAYLVDVNSEPVVHTWAHKFGEARKSRRSLDSWRPAERNAFLDHGYEHTVVEPLKTKSPSERRLYLAPQLGAGFCIAQFSAVFPPSCLQRC